MKHFLPRCLLRLSILLTALPVAAHEAAEPHSHAAVSSRASGPAKVVVQAEPGPNPWTHLNLKNDPRNFQFAIVADRTGGHRPGIFEDAVRKLNLLRPEFVMSVGDLIEGYTTNEARIDRQWKEFMSFTAQLEMPFFYVPGNHDISNPVMAKEWEERFGRSYYHFVYQDVLFLCLNSEDARPGNLSDEQIKYMAAALQANKNVRWTLLFFHRPLWVPIERAEAAKATTANAPPPPDNGWRKMEALLKDRPYTVFAGHYHNYMKYERNDRRYIILATTGGGSGLRGPVFGQFDHVAWVTMTDEGPLLANLMLDGIWDENIRTEKQNAVLAPLMRAGRISVAPLFTQSPVLQGYSTQLRLVNNADYPMKVQGTFGAHDYLRPDPHAIDLTVPPNSVRLIDLRLHTKRALRVGDVAPLVLETTLAYEVPGYPRLEMKGAHNLVVEKLNEAPRRKTPAKLDGRLDEWAQLPIVCEKPAQTRMQAQTGKGPRDASFRFACQHDGNSLYIAVQTVDDVVRAQPGVSPSRQDGIEVRLDARPEAVASQGRDERRQTETLRIALSPGETPEKAFIVDKDKLPKGVRAVSVKTATGHITEIAVPASYLNQKQGGAWKSFRLNIAVNDSDEPGERGAQIWWRPQWRSGANYAGSGTFVRRD